MIGPAESDPKTVVVIPTLNEAGNIAEIISRTLNVSGISYVLVVDDDSKDGTPDIVTGLADKNPNVILIRHPPPPGFAGSYLSGFKEAIKINADYIIQMDADGSHPPEVLTEIIKGLSSHDLVIASRYVENGGVAGWSKLRLFISRIGNFYARLILDKPIRDFTGGFNGWRAGLLQKVISEPCNCRGYAFQIWLKYRASRLDASIKEIPFIFQERRSGQPKFGPHIIWEALLQVWEIKKTS